MIIGIIAFIVFAVIAAGLYFYAFSGGTVDDFGRKTSGGVNLGGLLAAIAFTFFALMSFGFTQIGAGQVGVVTSFGEVHEEEMPPGLHWRFPVLNQVNEIDTRVRAVRVEGYTAASQEQQDLFMNITLNYHVIPDRASDIVQQVGTDFQDKIVMPRFLDIPKSITDDYKTTIVLNSRDEIRERAKDELSKALEPYGLVVDTINIENFSYSEAYNLEIEAKQAAEQRVETARQKQREAEVLAETARIQAEGEANARIEQARGEAEANRLLAESISDQLIQWQSIQKLNPNVEIMLVPSDNGFILDMEQLRPQDEETP